MIRLLLYLFQALKHALYEASITYWKSTSQYPLGRINTSLGLAGKIDAETQALLASQDINEDPFSDEVRAN